MNTEALMNLAVERSCADADLWPAYWEQRELDGDLLWAIVRRTAHLFAERRSSDLRNSGTTAAACVLFSVGYELGKLASDPASHVNDDRPKDDPRYQRGAH